MREAIILYRKSISLRREYHDRSSAISAIMTHVNVFFAPGEGDSVVHIRIHPSLLARAESDLRGISEKMSLCLSGFFLKIAFNLVY